MRVATTSARGAFRDGEGGFAAGFGIFEAARGDFSRDGQFETVRVKFEGGDESLTSLAVYFRNWHMFREHMNNMAC